MTLYVPKVLFSLVLLSSGLFGCAFQCSARDIAPKPAFAKPVSSKSVVISFPEDRSLGKLYIKPCISYLDLEPMKLIGDARGKIAIPAHALLHLVVSYEDSRDTSRLRTLPNVFSSVDFRRKPITDDGLKNIRHLTNLRQLNLSDTEISNQGLDQLTALKNIEALQLWQTNLRGPLNALTQFPKLKYLQLHRNNLDDRSVAPIARLRSLEALNVFRCGLTGRSLQSFSKCPNLRTVDLGDNKIDDASLSNFVDTKIRSIGLRGTPVTASAIQYLKRMPALTFISLTESNLSRADKISFKKSLPRCTIGLASRRRKIPAEFFEPLPDLIKPLSEIP